MGDPGGTLRQLHNAIRELTRRSANFDPTADAHYLYNTFLWARSLSRHKRKEPIARFTSARSPLISGADLHLIYATKVRHRSCRCLRDLRGFRPDQGEDFRRHPGQVLFRSQQSIGRIPGSDAPIPPATAERAAERAVEPCCSGSE